MLLLSFVLMMMLLNVNLLFDLQILPCFLWTIFNIILNNIVAYIVACYLADCCCF